MQEQTIGDLQRALLYVLVRPVYRIAGLKGYDTAPAPFAKEVACFRGILTVLRERQIAGTVYEADAAAQQPLVLVKESLNPWMRPVGCAIDRLRFATLVVGVFLGR